MSRIASGVFGLALTSTVTACVPQYNVTPAFPTPAEIAATPTLNYPSTSQDDRVAILSRNWPKANARCIKVRAAMQKEADAINAKNKAVGASFVGITAALAATSGLYASLKRDPDPTVTALLAFGASGTAVPSFFFLGSDDREKLVRSRIDSIDAKRAAFDDQWKAFQTVEREVSLSRNDVSAKRSARAALDCQQHQDDCKTADAALAQAEKTQTEAFAKWFVASDNLTQSADALDEACQ